MPEYPDEETTAEEQARQCVSSLSETVVADINAIETKGSVPIGYILIIASAKPKDWDDNDDFDLTGRVYYSISHWPLSPHNTATILKGCATSMEKDIETTLLIDEVLN